jgi:glycine/D-amino acid oxidase-like deaminating enzyme
MKFSTNKLIFTTNAFPPKGMDHIAPGRGQVLITKPIKGLEIKGCFHFDEGYYYFRNVEDRILFGGGRNIDFEKEASNEFEINEKIQQDLVEKLKAIILPETPFEIEMQWSGIMAFSDNRLPRIEQIDEHVFYAMNCNGMGVSLSPITAEEIAQII